MIRAAFIRDSLVVLRIEFGADGLNRCDTTLAKQFDHLLMNQFDTFAEAFDITAGGRLQCAFEIIDDWQQVGQRICRCGVGLIASVAFDSLAIVVEFSRRSQQSILQRVLSRRSASSGDSVDSGSGCGSVAAPADS